MKAHTSGFKNGLKELGRQLKGVITYGQTTLENEIYSITPHFEANILKSVMKQLDLELSVDIPLETVINCQIGIKVNDNYEMLNYGNYVVYSSEKQEDTGIYKITCYDKMLYSMKQNESLGVTYPITILNYLTALATKIGLTVASETFYNSSLTIPSELYLGLDYTYRDILDEIAQATGSIIVLNENDEIEVRYPTQTNDTINEEYLKDINVAFGKMYGTINTIVLSRSGESDNVYYPAILPENPVEIKIVDNQIMNFNNRSDFLPGIYNALNGLYYYINNFSSTGVLYYEVGDIYNVQIGENTYQCLMLNDEVNVTTGIEEIIHTDMPEQSETDYEKSDKTDQKTNLIVNKQKKEILAEVVGNNEVIAKINLAIQDEQGVINITGNQVTIESDNFELNANGDVICRNANITGGKIEIESNDDVVFRAYSGSAEVTISNNGIYVTQEVGDKEISITGEKIKITDRFNATEISANGIVINEGLPLLLKGQTIEDLNNLVRSGIYYVGNTSVSNAPSGFGTYYCVKVIRFSDTFYHQYAYKRINISRNINYVVNIGNFRINKEHLT